MWVLLFPWAGLVVHDGVSKIVGETPTQCDVELLNLESPLSHTLFNLYIGYLVLGNDALYMFDNIVLNSIPFKE